MTKQLLFPGMNTTPANQLALPAPYGYADGYHISLRAEDGFNGDETANVICQFGCPRRIAAKAVSCLEHSGRYDCVVSPQWFVGSEQGRLQRRLNAAGARMEVRSAPNTRDPGREARHTRQFGPRFVTARNLQNLPRSHFDPANVDRYRPRGTGG